MFFWPFVLLGMCTVAVACRRLLLRGSDEPIPALPEVSSFAALLRRASSLLPGAAQPWVPVVDELCRTEVAYVASLASLRECRQALAEVPLGSVDVLHAVATELAERLAGGSGAGDVSLVDVARAFRDMSPFLRAYRAYVAEQFERLQCCERLRRKADGRRRIAELESRLGEPLGSCLIKPVQRLCKYPLLLGALVKSLPADAAERAELQRVPPARFELAISCSRAC